MGGEERLLREMLRECELALEQQLAVFRELDDKTEQMVPSPHSDGAGRRIVERSWS